MRGPKRNVLQRENDYEQIKAYYVRGWSQVAIAEAVGLSQQQVSVDIRTIQSRWARNTDIDFDQAKQKELARLDELEREFWQAWESSKSERTKARQEIGSEKDKNGKPVVNKSSMEKEQRDGNPAFLQGVLSCIDRRCKLLGIDAPVETNLRNVVTLRVVHGDERTDS